MGKYKLGQKKLQEISFVCLITSCLSSGSGRPRAAGLGGLVGAVIRALGARLHPLPEFSSRWCPGARLKRAAALLGSLSYSATRWQVRATAEEKPGPSRPASFPPLARSFAPHELFVPAQSRRSNSSLIPPSQVSCRVGHTPVLAHAEPELGGPPGTAGALDHPSQPRAKSPQGSSLQRPQGSSAHLPPPPPSPLHRCKRDVEGTRLHSVSRPQASDRSIVCPRVCSTSKATSQLKRGGYGDSS